MFKRFVMDFCDDKTKKNIKWGWIMLYICAGLSTLAAVLNGTFPLDGIIFLGLALWLHLTYSNAAAITACVVAVLEVILNVISTGKMSGYLVVIAAVYAAISTGKAKKAYKVYQETGRMPQQ